MKQNQDFWRVGTTSNSRTNEEITVMPSIEIMRELHRKFENIPPCPAVIVGDDEELARLIDQLEPMDKYTNVGRPRLDGVPIRNIKSTLFEGSTWIYQPKYHKETTSIDLATMTTNFEIFQIKLFPGHQEDIEKQAIARIVLELKRR